MALHENTTVYTSKIRCSAFHKEVISKDMKASSSGSIFINLLLSSTSEIFLVLFFRQANLMGFFQRKNTSLSNFQKLNLEGRLAVLYHCHGNSWGIVDTQKYWLTIVLGKYQKSPTEKDRQCC